ncbi:MAG: lamin tail domain-containing protein [Pyrinomonadaceae bacterium]|nr:lamin tail domain-containing protein [Pyrinomonadaceae bacterium]
MRARAGGQQSSATLTIKAVVATAQLTPEAVILTAGNSATLTATARDASGSVISDALFIFSLSNQSTANTASIIRSTPNTVTVRSAGAGSVTVVATYTRPSDNARIEDASLLTIKAASSTPIPTTGQVIINEALVSFADSTTQPRHDFIELFNTTNQTFDISGLSISFRLTDSVSPRTVVLPGAVGSGRTLIMPSGYFLIVNGAGTFGVTADYNAEVEGFDLTSAAGGIKIEIGGVRLDGLVYKERIDTALPAPFDTFGEGDVFVLDSSSSNRDLVRSPNGTDTNNNLNDFRRNGTAGNVKPKAANLTIP